MLSLNRGCLIKDERLGNGKMFPGKISTKGQSAFGFFWLELAGVWACTREAYALTTIPAE